MPSECQACGKRKSQRRTWRGRNCWQCAKRKWREANPLKSDYANLRDHAHARYIGFSISFEYFSKFARESEYVERTGPGGHHLTVDRIDNLKGYVPGNIQPMTRQRNSEKRQRYDAIRADYPNTFNDPW